MIKFQPRLRVSNLKTLLGRKEKGSIVDIRKLEHTDSSYFVVSYARMLKT